MILDLALVLEGSYCQIGPKAYRLYNADPKIKIFSYPKFIDSYLSDILSSLGFRRYWNFKWDFDLKEVMQFWGNHILGFNSSQNFQSVSEKKEF